MTMLYLASVPRIETDTGIEFFSPTAHISLDFPLPEYPGYHVLDHMACDFIAPSMRSFDRLADALDHVAMRLRIA